MGVSTKMLGKLVWFYVGFVLVNFASLLWLFITSYLTIYTDIPLPYFMLYIPSNIAMLALITLALILGLYIYLGVVLIRSGLDRGYVPIAFVVFIVVGIALLLIKQFVASIAFLIIALALLVSNYGVLTSIATHRASRYMWLVGALLIIAAVILALINRSVVNYVGATIQSLSILACAIEVWSIMGRLGKGP
ncbi:hypothetical protein VMUT_2012 [Vulcanisaeta moutnovskia 768-28]|uniref:Uncharacterized protein n=1 Tax=Vulcanisaeta moutnovskia (strain 768-28) TaxID=985053 RepID=F0QWB6_VULM7|nr:hypothetical protein [Vulcanisaeta moutnovskia]ADY02211.1 hypothetical protein VMUT_2012 [Vulcanisaeta moutnovskia 768-28]